MGLYNILLGLFLSVILIFQTIPLVFGWPATQNLPHIYCCVIVDLKSSRDWKAISCLDEASETSP